MTILFILIGFIAFTYVLSYILSKRLDNQVSAMIEGFIKSHTPFDVDDLKSNAVYSIVYRALPQFILFLLLFGATHIGFLTAVMILYLGVQVFLALIKVVVLINIPNQDFAERVVARAKEVL